MLLGSGIAVAIQQSNATRCLTVGTHNKSGTFVLFLFQLVTVAIQQSNATRCWTVGTHSKSGTFVLFLFQLVTVAIQQSNATRCWTVGTHSKSGTFVLFLLMYANEFRSTHQSWRFLMAMRADRKEMNDPKERTKNANVYYIEWCWSEITCW